MKKLPQNNNLPASPCETCPVQSTPYLKKLGIETSDWDYVIALAGNPNTGKSTVFNALTGLRQHTGNWPGKTVGRAEGGFEYSGKKFKIVDLPGTYSLLSTSADEEVARDFILFGQPDVTVVVADATRLERNLNIILQILEITDRVVLCLNLMDEAQRHNLTINVRQLEKDLGVPVVPTAARNTQGIPALLEKIDGVSSGRIKCKPYRIKNESPEIKHALDTLVPKLLKAFPKLPNARWVALRLLDNDEKVIDAVRAGHFLNI